MPRYRIAIRYGEVRQKYHVADLEASSLRAALRQAADTLPEEVDHSASLAEIRRTVEPESRPGGSG